MILALIGLYNLAKLGRWFGAGGWLHSWGPAVENVVVFALIAAMAALMLAILGVSIWVLHVGTDRQVRALLGGRRAANHPGVLDDEDARGRAIRVVGRSNAVGRMHEEP